MATFCSSIWSSSLSCAIGHLAQSGYFFSITGFSGAGVDEVISVGIGHLYDAALVLNALGRQVGRLDGSSFLLYGWKSVALTFRCLPVCILIA